MCFEVDVQPMLHAMRALHELDEAQACTLVQRYPLLILNVVNNLSSRQ